MAQLMINVFHSFLRNKFERREICNCPIMNGENIFLQIGPNLDRQKTPAQYNKRDKKIDTMQ